MVSTCLLMSFDGRSWHWTVLDGYPWTNFIFFASTCTWRILQTSRWRFQCLWSSSVVDGLMCSVPKCVLPCLWYLMHFWWVVLTPSFFFFMKYLCARFCCCCWVGLLRWSGHHFPLPWKSPCWYHLDSDASKETVTSGPCKGQHSPT